MKTKTLALFASLVVLTTVARAAQYETLNEVVVLPTYTVEAPRYTSVEKQINASLDEMRRQAKTLVAVPADFPSLKAAAQADPKVAVQGADKKVVQLAKS